MICDVAEGAYNASARAAGVAEALVYATDNGARVMNVGMNVSPSSIPGLRAVLRDAVLYAFDSDRLHGRSASNFLVRAKVIPAAWPELLGVMALGADERYWPDSNYGPWYDLTAPASNITSLTVGGGRSGSCSPAPPGPRPT